MNKLTDEQVKNIGIAITKLFLFQNKIMVPGALEVWINELTNELTYEQIIICYNHFKRYEEEFLSVQKFKKYISSYVPRDEFKHEPIKQLTASEEMGKRELEILQHVNGG